MFDLLLVVALGFLGSFGHCVGMCGPLTLAFALSQTSDTSAQTQLPISWQRQFWFHSLLNLGRILSYALVGAGIGAVGSVLVAGGQLAGIDSFLRRGLAIVTGGLLVWMGLVQVAPGLLPRLPMLHPLTANHHQKLSQVMMRLSLHDRAGTPLLLGMVWGLIPCGFLYAAQVKAAETGNLWQGTLTLLAFGLGTTPSMLAVGLSSSLVSADRRSQLFRLGGWVTLTIGILTLYRSSEMVDHTGHAALICLMLALIARPMSRLWSAPLKYRRLLGVAAFVLAIAHTLHMVDHTLGWNWRALGFLPRIYQVALWLGILALGLLLPAALTSSNAMMQSLGRHWRSLHLLAVPALILGTIHTILIGSSYLGGADWSLMQKLGSIGLSLSVLGVLLLRSRRVWALFSLTRFYAAPTQSK